MKVSQEGIKIFNTARRDVIVSKRMIITGKKKGKQSILIHHQSS